MEKIKKTILQAVTTGITACTGTSGICHIIIPDLSAVYYFKIGLKQKAHDMGFFDAYVVENININENINNNIEHELPPDEGDLGGGEIFLV